MILHKSNSKFDFALIMIILRQNSKKKYIKYSKFYKRSQILNCLEFNDYRILLYEINFHWRISMSVNTFPLEVFDFGVSFSSIVYKAFSNQKNFKNTKNLFRICVEIPWQFHIYSPIPLTPRIQSGKVFFREFKKNFWRLGEKFWDFWKPFFVQFAGVL